MGIERSTVLDKKMTQVRRKPANGARQRELPLRRQSLPPSSKLIFQLKAELSRLQQRDREWKLMFNMLGHDLKEPLVTLEGFTKLLEEGNCDTSDQKRYLKIIREAINSLHLLVGSLQSVSKLYHDPSELVELSLHEIFNNVISSLSRQISKTKGKVELNFEDTILLGDPVRLYQIFLNLIANSLKFHKKETPPIIKVETKLSGGFLRVAISDNGVGMSQEDLKKIFEPFTRLDSSSDYGDGMGMGLSIVKRIAESFGGRVQVKSQQGIGTTFFVLLPRKPQWKGVKTYENPHRRR